MPSSSMWPKYAVKTGHQVMGSLSLTLPVVPRMDSHAVSAVKGLFHSKFVNKWNN